VAGATLVALVLCVGATLVSPGASAQLSQQTQSLDGSANNRNRPDWGRAGTAYTRVAAARYADGRSQPVSGPNSRFVSNRIFNDVSQNLFSENGVSQWGFTWGQFLDHTFGLRDEAGTVANIPFNQGDPLESFTNTLGSIPFTRSAATPGTGVSNPRQQTNTVSSYIDAWAVYGGTDTRLDWLREGSNDGNPNNNSAKLLLDPSALLPRRDARGNAATAPTMATDGRLIGQPGRAMVAGDVRANENIALTATHTLFAREHNRIVGLLPRILSEDTKFAIARRIVIAEQQWITYNEFLPSLGVRLPAYQGYNPNVNANLGNEFATVGYRAHSMIHGEIELETDAARYTETELSQLRALGVEIIPSEEEPGVVELVVPLNVAFFNPDLVGLLELGPLLQGIGLEAQYKNDEQIDNQLRSVLFQVPVSGNPGCLDGPELPECFRGVVDLGAIDIERGRDHGMPTYNQLRNAFGLSSRTSFRAVTGEATESFPTDPELTLGNEINDPDSLDFVRLIGRDGQDIPLDSEEAEASAVQGIRRTSTAARLRAVYGSVNNLDAFTGMISEPHVAGTEFGELQLAMWRRQFQALRDGDRFFYGNDPNLNLIRLVYGIDFRRSLGDVIALNTDIPRNELEPNVFLAPVD
jgi:hypothetical protein